MIKPFAVLIRSANLHQSKQFLWETFRIFQAISDQSDRWDLQQLLEVFLKFSDEIRQSSSQIFSESFHAESKISVISGKLFHFTWSTSLFTCFPFSFPFKIWIKPKWKSMRKCCDVFSSSTGFPFQCHRGRGKSIFPFHFNDNKNAKWSDKKFCSLLLQKSLWQIVECGGGVKANAADWWGFSPSFPWDLKTYWKLSF